MAYIDWFYNMLKNSFDCSFLIFVICGHFCRILQCGLCVCAKYSHNIQYIVAPYSTYSSFDLALNIKGLK